MIKRLFFDIETSYCQGWFWKPAYETQITYDQVLKDSAIICICYKWAGGKKTYSLQWDKGSDKAMMKKFYEIICAADEIIGHNGDKYDLRWVRTRFLKHGFKSVPKFKSIDTLKISRSMFLFKSNRLDNIGKELGFGGKKDTGGIELWHDIIQRNSKTAMNKMVSYCKRDVELLEKVYNNISGFTEPKTHAAVHSGNYKWDCPHCASSMVKSKGSITSSVGVVQYRMLCNGCKRYFRISNSVFVKRKEHLIKEQIKELNRKNDAKMKSNILTLE